MDQKRLSQICRELVRFGEDEADVQDAIVALQSVNWTVLFEQRSQMVEKKERRKRERAIERSKVRPTVVKTKAQVMEEKKAAAAELRKLPYADYLKTPEWAKTRLRALKFANFRCQLCNSTENLNVHHRTYERLGWEKPSDLIVLCKTHHEEFHKSGKLVKEQ